MFTTPKFGLPIWNSAALPRHGWVKRSYRRAVAERLSTKWLLVLGGIAVVGYFDLITGPDLSFSIFYLLPIAYATWFVQPQAGVLSAVLGAGVWLSVEVTFGMGSSNPLIPVWNAGVRLVFFLIGVAALTLVKRTEGQLLREVLTRTRSLRTEAERRRRLEREMVEISAREQVRLAQHLHDGLGQYLSAMAFHARMLTDDLRERCSPQLAQAERMVELIRITNRITRQIDRALCVPEAGPGGFFGAVRALIAEFEQLTGLRCEVQFGEQPLMLDEFRTLMLFRIVQEALNNAVKHGKPRVIRVNLAVVDRTLSVTVLDDGPGFSAVCSAEGGSGLRIMKVRAELIGARLQIGSAEGGGGRVACVVPLGPNEEVPRII
jgi:signal transduction histidine kinase